MNLIPVKCHKCGRSYKVLRPSEQSFCSKMCAGNNFAWTRQTNLHVARGRRKLVDLEQPPEDHEDHRDSELIASHLIDPSENLSRYRYED